MSSNLISVLNLQKKKLIHTYTQVAPQWRELAETVFDLTLQGRSFKRGQGSSFWEYLEPIDEVRSTLDYLIANIDNPERIESYLMASGRRHFHQGIDKALYSKIEKAILSSLSIYFRNRWQTEGFQGQWSSLLDFARYCLEMGYEAEKMEAKRSA